MNTPIGSIVAWAGSKDTIPKGWRVCDGSTVSAKDHPKLCKSIGDAWGEVSGEWHQLPDLRGMFLRGVSEDRDDGWQDPNIEDRIVIASNKKNDVGSLQQDELASHQHNIRYRNVARSTEGKRQPGEANLNGHSSTGSTTTTTGGKETRPNNAYIFYIIRVD